MKIVTVLGSPRKEGNTARILHWIEDELAAAGHETDRVNLIDHRVEGCVACYACQMDKGFNGCAETGDDANDILNRLRDADAVVFSSPLYMWNFAAQAKALMDRSLCLAKGYLTDNHRSSVEGKPIALLVTCAGVLKNNADLIGPVFDRFCKFLKARKVAELIVPLTTHPDQLSDGVREQVREVVEKLTA